MPTIEEKYKWLCSKLQVTDIDYWEGDAILRLRDSGIYFQFSLKADNVSDVDKAVERAMNNAA